MRLMHNYCVDVGRYGLVVSLLDQILTKAKLMALAVTTQVM